MASNQLATVPDVNLVKNLSSPLQEYDALVVVASELDQIAEFVDS
ncbi:unnamed protein product, partial [Rotaria magnacalcarata]